jgi:hypothetical protein
MVVEFDRYEFAGQCNRSGPSVTGSSLVITLGCATHADADAGYGSRQMPYDAFRGSRFAAVADPDGDQIGLRSPGVAAAPDPAAHRRGGLHPPRRTLPRVVR